METKSAGLITELSPSAWMMSVCISSKSASIPSLSMLNNRNNDVQTNGNLPDNDSELPYSAQIVLTVSTNAATQASFC
jgi:hypothetical protein